MGRGWIALDEEREVLRFLKSGRHSHRTIATLTGVSHWVVDKIAKGRIRKSNDMKPSDGIMNLLEPKMCPRCRAMVVQWPCPLCHPPDDALQNESDNEINGNRLAEEVPELLRIVTDLHDLHALQLIPHLLFIELARRAHECLSRIWRKM